MPLIGRRKILDMFNFLVKNTTDLWFGRQLCSTLGSFLDGRSKKRYNACGSVFSVSELHNSSRQYHYLFKCHGIICRYKKIVLLPTKRKIRPFVGCQKDANIHLSVPTSLYDPAINLYTSVVHFIKFRRLVESALYSLS